MEFNNSSMKYIISVFLLFPFFLSSCSVPRYIVESNGQNTGLDFTTGKWLLNFVDATAGTQNKLTTMAVSDFSQALGARLVYVAEASGLLLPKMVEMNPSKSVIKRLKTGTDFDYFINIKANDTKKQLGNVDFSNHHFNKGGINESELILEVYDLNTSEIIYSQKVIAFVARENDNNDVHFAKSNDDLIIGAYKKMIDQLMKKSITNK
tara:strand:+ start:2018 stop:2641 length:624 start_codon:yes stop_codon:yes gene_type:complete